MTEEFGTPMMKQYLAMKAEYPDCILFYRMGDFYEMFLEDAEIGSKVLDITLTSRDKGPEKKIMMAGVPFHAADSYIAKMVSAGYKVAIAEQVSDPKLPGLVERKVVRIVTPGTQIDSGELDSRKSNYLCAITFEKDWMGLGVVDISTGEFMASQMKTGLEYKRLADELIRLNPSEVILSSKFYDNVELISFIVKYSRASVFVYRDWERTVKKAGELLIQKLGKPLVVWGMNEETDNLAIESAAALLGYLEYTQKKPKTSVTSLRKYQGEGEMYLDRSTILNLEIFATLRDGDLKGSLIEILDQCLTPMGSRMLKGWARTPLVNQERIEERHQAIGELVKNENVRKGIVEKLSLIRDIERMVARLAAGWGNARDLAGLRESMRAALGLKELLSSVNSKSLVSVNDNLLSQLYELVEMLDKRIVQEAPADVRGGKMICSGVDVELDELRDIHTGGRDWLVEFERQEKMRTGISTLKVRFNKVFGFYIEISKGQLSSVPDNYIRRQTLVNAERYITEELKVHEDKVLTAEEKIVEIEFRIFSETVEIVLERLVEIQKLANGVATLDCLVGWSELAIKNKYVMPEWNNGGLIEIKDGRHPVVEKLNVNSQFVPNDLILNHKDRQILTITGPNMAGKSVYLRQAAVICLMAQMGCWVPAKSANLSIVDRVFVRSGASDAMAKGLSTFMVEMTETAGILAQATEKSLIVMDEIGRGTSTFDGISLAWAITEWLVSIKWKKDGVVNGPKTLFATHYHELQQLADEYEQIQNVQVAVADDKGVPVFLHKVIAGGASHSYGVAVAKMAGVPEDLIERAKEILGHLEGKRVSKPPKKLKVEAAQLSFGVEEEHELVKQMRDLDVNKLTPLEALKLLDEWKRKL